VLFRHVEQLAAGLLVTVQITLGGALLAAACAFVGGLGLLSRDSVVRGVCRAYVEVFRGTSALVQLFWFFYALPLLLGVRLEPRLCGVLVLGLNVGAYAAEVVRGAVTAVPRSQWEAGVALSLSRRQTLAYVVLPQALRAMLPPFGNLVIELLKGTSLVSMIAVVDLTQAGLFIRDDTLRTGRVLGVVLVLYFCLAWVISRGFRLLESRLSRGRVTTRVE
jgi:polar amino acid transport system permease protein